MTSREQCGTSLLTFFFANPGAKVIGQVAVKLQCVPRDPLLQEARYLGALTGKSTREQLPAKALYLAEDLAMLFGVYQGVRVGRFRHQSLLQGKMGGRYFVEHRYLVEQAFIGVAMRLAHDLRRGDELAVLLIQRGVAE